MKDNLNKYEQIIKANTNFLLNANRIDHVDFTTELNRYLIELKNLMEFDTILSSPESTMNPKFFN